MNTAIKDPIHSYFSVLHSCLCNLYVLIIKYIFLKYAPFPQFQLYALSQAAQHPIHTRDIMVLVKKKLSVSYLLVQLRTAILRLNQFIAKHNSVAVMVCCMLFLGDGGMDLIIY